MPTPRDTTSVALPVLVVIVVAFVAIDGDRCHFDHEQRTFDHQRRAPAATGQQWWREFVLHSELLTTVRITTYVCTQATRKEQGVRISVLRGGPGGVYFSALVQQLDPRPQGHLWERDAPDGTFGLGGVFADGTAGGIEHAGAAVFARMEREFARWDDIDVHFHGTVLPSGGHGFAAMSRHRLLAILQQRCAEVGVRTQFRAEAPAAEVLASGYDLVVAADG